MVDDDMMDEWLREAMAGETPCLSPTSDDKVIASIRPRRLATAARVVIALYAIGALALSAWAMKEIGVALVLASTPVAALITAGVST
jgi:hypothetical protein